MENAGYHHLFNPDAPVSVKKGQVATPDLKRPEYVFSGFSENITFRVNVALAIQRPLLVQGRSGTGKSSLAYAVARILNYRYEELIVTSRTTVQDLLWSSDNVRRLADAQDGSLRREPLAYVQAGILWRAFQPETVPQAHRPTNVARSKAAGAKATSARKGGASQASGRTGKSPTSIAVEQRPAVVLLDEIDKAEPDLPNDLLGPLSSYEFSVPGLAAPIVADRQRRPLIIITTNDERDLPLAFMRRCVVLNLDELDDVPAGSDKAERLKQHRHQIAAKHVAFLAEQVADLQKPDDTSCTALFKKLDELFENMTSEARNRRVRLPCIAEYLDAVRACILLKIHADHPSLDPLVYSAAWKNARRPGGVQL